MSILSFLLPLLVLAWCCIAGKEPVSSFVSVRKRRIYDALMVHPAGSWKTAFLATVLFMLAAYLYLYTNGNFAIDAGYLYRNMFENYTIWYEKWLYPIRNVITLGVNQPWVSGLLTTFWVALSVCLTTDILEIRSKAGIILTAGLFATHHSIIMLAFYIELTHANVLAMFWSVLAVWIMERKPFSTAVNILSAILLLACSGGVYAAFMSTASTLMILRIMLDLLHGKNTADAWKKSFGYAGVFTGGVFSFYAILRILLAVVGGDIGGYGYMGVDKLTNLGASAGMIENLPATYLRIINYYLGRHIFLPPLLIFIQRTMLITGVFLTVYVFVSYMKKMTKKSASLFLLWGLLIAVLPFSINFITFAAGWVHQLMTFPYVLPFVFFLREGELLAAEKRFPSGVRLRIPYAVFCGIYIVYSISFSNIMAVYMENGYESTRSIATRLLDRIETCEGFAGDETVVMVGNIHAEFYYAQEGRREPDVLNLTHLEQGLGMFKWPNYLGGESPPGVFLREIMDSRLEYIEYNAKTYVEESGDMPAVQSEVLAMPAYPRQGSVKKIGNVIYVRFADEE